MDYAHRWKIIYIVLAVHSGEDSRQLKHMSNDDKFLSMHQTTLFVCKVIWKANIIQKIIRTIYLLRPVIAGLLAALSNHTVGASTPGLDLLTCYLLLNKLRRSVNLAWCGGFVYTLSYWTVNNSYPVVTPPRNLSLRVYWTFLQVAAASARHKRLCIAL